MTDKCYVSRTLLIPLNITNTKSWKKKLIMKYNIMYIFEYIIHTSKHISDSTRILLCVLFEQHAKSVGYRIEVNVGLLKYWNGNVQSNWSTVGDGPDCNID